MLTLEDDNIPPPDAHIRLLESMEWGGYDAVSGLYFTKGEVNMPMAYGDPAEYAKTGVMDFRPRDVKEALAAGQIMARERNRYGMRSLEDESIPGDPSSLVRDDERLVPGKGVVGMTQDLACCQKMRLAGKTLAVDLRVRVGHLDVASGTVF